LKARPDVAVIGAGAAGLAAASALVDAGARVAVYEERSGPGGLLRTDGVDVARADVAVQLLGSYYRETFRLARAAGAASLLTRAPGRDALWRGGRSHPISYGSVASMAVSSALPTGLKLRLATKYVPFLRRSRGALDANEPAAAVGSGLDRESIAEWGRRELGDDFVELLVYPQLAAYYGATPEETSAGFYHALAAAGMEQLEVYAVRGGAGELADALARALVERGAAVRYGVEVTGVRAGPAGVDVDTADGVVHHEAAVLAVPAASARALAGLEGPAGEWVDGVRAAPVASLTLVLDRPLGTGYFGLAFPRTEPPGERLAAICVQSEKAAGLPGGGRGALVLYPSPSYAAALVAASPREALEALLPAVEQAFPGLGRRVVRAKLCRFPRGGTVFYPGYLGHLQRFDPSWLGPRLALAGDYLVAPTVEGAVRSGLRAAERILASLSGQAGS